MLATKDLSLNALEGRNTGADRLAASTPGARRAMLVPVQPRADLLALLDSQGIAAVWPNGSTFTDTAAGAFV